MLFIFALFTVTFARHVDLPYRALHNPDLFEGDIVGIEDNDARNAIVNPDRLWKDGVVIYAVDSSLEHIRDLITEAMNHITKETSGCITFKERRYERDYVKFTAADGCYSSFGQVGGAQTLSLGEGCEFVGVIVHEIGHALGFFHEHNRSDRDDYITIYWDNIQPGSKMQFIKMPSIRNKIFNEFDYESIMIYGNYAFSKDGKSVTMEAKTGVKLREPYEKSGLTASDVYRIKKLYQCE
ncbi:astacin-like metalloprotease toxin 5 [Centruroides vittatus]|uniref:astacin-like metalloprotease toxin 5 n=1 Tax=Centruroides vittatus TaxID=120091 RepID=UPI00350F122C